MLVSIVHKSLSSILKHHEYIFCVRFDTNLQLCRRATH